MVTTMKFSRPTRFFVFFSHTGVRQVLLDQLKSLQQEPVTTAVDQPTTSTAVELQAVEQVTSSDTSHSRSPSQQLRYIASGTSGGVAGTLASLLSRMCMYVHLIVFTPVQI